MRRDSAPDPAGGEAGAEERSPRSDEAQSSRWPPTPCVDAARPAGRSQRPTTSSTIPIPPMRTGLSQFPQQPDRDLLHRRRCRIHRHGADGDQRRCRRSRQSPQPPRGRPRAPPTRTAPRRVLASASVASPCLSFGARRAGSRIGDLMVAEIRCQGEQRPARTRPRLYARTVEIDDPGPLAALLPERDAYAWVRRGEGMVGWGEVVRSKPASVAEAEEWWTDLVSQVVSVSDLDHTRRAPASWPSAASCSIRRPPPPAPPWSCRSTVLGRRNGRAWLTQIGTSFVHDDTLPPVTAARAPPRTISYADGGADRAAVGGGGGRGRPPDRRRRAGQGGAGPGPARPGRASRHRPALDPGAGWRSGTSAAGRYLVDGLVGATPEMLLRRENGLVDLPGAGRHHPAQRRRRPRPGLGGGAGPLQQGPGGARVRGALGARTRWRRTAPG